MPTILLLEDNPDDRALIRRTLSGTATVLLEADSLDDSLKYLASRHIDVAVVSLPLIPEQAVAGFQRILFQLPDIKVVALAPSQSGNGLATLLKAESLHAHHLLPKPIFQQHLLTILDRTFPLPTTQD